MDVFLSNITSFPVVVYTFLLMVVVFYWLLALLGAMDIEILDADIDLDTDVDLEMDTDVDAQGLGGVTGFMLKWGLTGVPVTVVISLLILISWQLSYFVVSLLFPLLPWEGLKTLFGFALLIISFFVAVPLTAIIIKPLKKLFVSHSAVKKASLIGLECVVKTGSVTNTFGQAELEDGGAGMILDVRADETLNIKKGDSVILIDYDETEGSYLVRKSN